VKKRASSAIMNNNCPKVNNRQKFAQSGHPDRHPRKITLSMHHNLLKMSKTCFESSIHIIYISSEKICLPIATFDIHLFDYHVLSYGQGDRMLL
jgi:hypothetical protein